ncbi:MAG: hypothetical protein K2Z80_16080, partial [Xanthobacteraceae bacterium]|nr:hypothetical protein [Xanthobacteraceae bacterium]
PETIPSCYRRSRRTEFQPLSGRHLKCLQQEFDVADADNADQAADYAARKFEMHHGLRSWNSYADLMEIELRICN